MKAKIQTFGRFLSGMVMPNIGAFIAWGLLTALFMESGWFPNEHLNSIVTRENTIAIDYKKCNSITKQLYETSINYYVSPDMYMP